MSKMNISKALAELKLLDARITKAIVYNTFVVSVLEKKGAKIDERLSKEEFSVKAEKEIQSVQDLIERRKKIKNAIVRSNAETVINISGVEMVVAEAIERKASIKYEKELLSNLQIQLKKAELATSKANTEADKKATELLVAVLGKESSKKPTPEEVEMYYRPKYNDNKAVVYDPCNVAGLIEKLEKEIEDFELNVDAELTTSNAITYIDI